MPNYTNSPLSTDLRVTSPSRYSKATHLTEFYPYLNGGIQQVQGKGQGIQEPSSFKFSHYRRKEPETLSMAESYTSFTPSTLDFRNLVTKTDIKQTTEAYDNIISNAEEYRNALLKVAEAAGNFGAALENGAKCKGTGTAAEGMLSASGLFFIVANHEQILAHSIKESLEDPIISDVNQFKLQTLKNDTQFKVDIQERVRDLKLQERENAKMSKGKTRNLLAYRTKLMELTSHIDEIDKLKHDYYQLSFDLVQETSNNILTRLGSIVRAQVEIYENIARKGWSGGGLDDLIAQCPDPFTNDEAEEKDDSIKHGDLLDGLNNDTNDTADTDDDDADTDVDANADADADTNADANADDSDTLEAKISKPKLQATNTGLIFNKSNGVTPLSVVTHQDSIQTFHVESLVSSTPIWTELDDTSQNNDISKKLDDKLHQLRQKQNPDESKDDNSFSLPILELSHNVSSSLIKNPKDDEAEGDKASGVEGSNTANVLSGVDEHKYWNRDTSNDSKIDNEEI